MPNWTDVTRASIATWTVTGGPAAPDHKFSELTPVEAALGSVDFVYVLDSGDPWYVASDTYVTIGSALEDLP